MVCQLRKITSHEATMMLLVVISHTHIFFFFQFKFTLVIRAPLECAVLAFLIFAGLDLALLSATTR